MKAELQRIQKTLLKHGRYFTNGWMNGFRPQIALSQHRRYDSVGWAMVWVTCWTPDRDRTQTKIQTEAGVMNEGTSTYTEGRQAVVNFSS